MLSHLKFIVLALVARNKNTSIVANYLAIAMTKQTKAVNRDTGINHHKTTRHCLAARRPLTMHVKMDATNNSAAIRVITNVESSILKSVIPPVIPVERANTTVMKQIAAANSDHSDTRAERGQCAFVAGCLSIRRSDRFSSLGFTR